MPVSQTSKPQLCTLSQQIKTHNVQFHDISADDNLTFIMCELIYWEATVSERHVCAGGAVLRRHYLTPDFPSHCSLYAHLSLYSFEVQLNPTEKCIVRHNRTPTPFCSTCSNLLLSSNHILQSFPWTSLWHDPFSVTDLLWRPTYPLSSFFSYSFFSNIRCNNSNFVRYQLTKVKVYWKWEAPSWFWLGYGFPRICRNTGSLCPFRDQLILL